MMFRRFFAFVLLLASLMFASSAFGQSIPTSTFAALPGSPSSGDLAFITDGSGSTTVGDPAAGGGSNRDLVAYDGVDARWEFVQRLPATAPAAPVETVLDANRVRYDNTTSGATAVEVQAALDEVFASGGGGGSTNLGTLVAPGDITVTSSTGSNAVIPAASPTTAGVITGANQTKLDGIAAGAQVDTNTNALTECSGSESYRGDGSCAVPSAGTLTSGRFDFCRSGTNLGGGFDASTGLYAWTCAGPAWASSTFIDCDGEASTSAGADGRCWASGEHIMVDGTLEAFVLAHDATVPGGSVYVPMSPGEDHAIFVYEECDLGTCPVIQQNYSDPRKNQPNRTAFISATHGRKFIGETECRVDPITRKRSGVCLVDNSGDGAFAGDWVFRQGLDQSVRICVPISSTDPTCDIDAAQSANDSPSHALTGVTSAISSTTASTQSNAGYTTLCLSNGITASHATTMGVCREDPRIRCTTAGDAARVSATTGGCDFGAGGDLGPCMGHVDYLEYAVETLGEPHTLGIRVSNFTEDGSAAPNGQQFHEIPVESVLDATACGYGACTGGSNDGFLCDVNGDCTGGGTCDGEDQDRFVRIGIDNGSTDLVRFWPFMTDSIEPRELTVNQVHILDQEARSLGNGYSYENIGFMPNNYFTRDSSLASADCVVGNESGCDERPLVGFLSGSGGGHKNALYWGCSEDVSKSCIDGMVSGLGVKVHNWTASNMFQGLLSDASRWDFDRGLVVDSTTVGGIFAVFVSASRICNIEFRNVRALYGFSSSYSKNVTICDMRTDGVYFRSGMIRLQSAVNWTVRGFDLGGLTGPFAMIGAKDDTTVRGITIEDVKAYGHSAPPISSGFGSDRAKAFIIISQSVSALNANQGGIGKITINNVDVESTLPETILVHFDAGDDNAAGGATTDDLGVEPYMDKISITNSSLFSTNGTLVSFMNGSSSANFDALDTLDYRTASRRPRMVNNRMNGVLLEDYNHSMGDASDFGDCGAMTHGSTVAIADDTAIGACSNTNGVLTGGGGSQSACKCDPLGNAGSGDWSAI